MTAILDTATDGVVILDASGRIESVSAGAEALFGLDVAELRGTDFGELLDPGEPRAARRLSLRAVRKRRGERAERGPRGGGSGGAGSIPLFMTIGGSRNDGGFCAVVRDITQWKRAEEELMRRARRPRRLLAEIGFSGARQSRDPHAAQRHHRLLRSDDRREVRAGGQRPLPRISARHQPSGKHVLTSSTTCSTFPRSRPASSRSTTMRCR